MTSSYKVEFSQLALDDLDQIFQYSVEKWNEDQANSYVTDILSAIDLLATFPYRGQIAIDSPSEVRQILVEKHRAFYQVVSPRIKVLRIVSPKLPGPTAFSEYEAEDEKP
jgi:toxin ParE1/3/4